MKPRVDDSLPCSEARAAVQARLDEPLPIDRDTALNRHLGECEACASYHADLGAMRDALRSMPLFDLPAGVRKGVRSAMGRPNTQ
jgi:anti-sigma factor RsiW